MEGLKDIRNAVFELAERKTDAVLNLTSLTPVTRDNVVQLRTKKGTHHSLVQNGLTSYLNRIGIPVGFFKKCNNENKRGLLEQFHAEHADQEVLLRKIDNNIRFMASSKYSCFDNHDVLDAFKDIDSDLKVKEHHNTDGHFVLRLVADPIQITDKKPFYPGVQVINSEIGESSVKIQFFLWEEVCTNGMVISRAQFPMYRMIHIGKKRHNDLKKALEQKIKEIPDFIDTCTKLLSSSEQRDAKEAIDRIQRSVEIPLNIKEKIKNKLEDTDGLSSLDVLSAMTNAIQSCSWSERLRLEEKAGDLLFAA